MAEAALWEQQLASGSRVVVDPARHKRKVLVAAVAGYASEAADLMVIALALPLLLQEWQITMFQGGTIVSAMLLGSCIGGCVSRPVSDRFGRKRALVSCIALFGLATGAGGLAQDYLQLASLRFLAGIGLGAQWSLGATMLAEFVPPKERGKANSWIQVGWPIGYGLAIVAQQVLVPTLGWRWLFFAGAVAVLVAGCIALWVPESPAWIEARREREAGSPLVSSRPGTGRRMEGVDLRTLVHATLVLVGVLVPFWALNSWLPTVLSIEKGMSASSVAAFLLALNAISIPAVFIAASLSDELGKRPVIVVSAIASAAILYVWLAYPWRDGLFWSLGLTLWVISSATWSSLVTFVAERFSASSRARGGLYGALATGRAAAVVVPPLLATAATDAIAIGELIAVTAVFLLVAGISAFMLGEDGPRRRVHGPTANW